jgi:hypothetical protein
VKAASQNNRRLGRAPAFLAALYRLRCGTRNQWMVGHSLMGRLSTAIHFKTAKSTSSNPAGRSGRLARWAVARIGEAVMTATIVDKRVLDSPKGNTTLYSLNN